VRKIVARAADAKNSAQLYRMPGGTPMMGVPFGTRLLVAGERLWCPRDQTWYFPVQVNTKDAILVLWASEAGFVLEPVE
jgi:hypothetical protein